MNRDKKRYKGLAFIGGDNIGSIYGVNNGIIDAKGTGIQHLFYKDYSQDLIHTMTTMVKQKDTVYFGNRIKSKKGHPNHVEPIDTNVIKGHIFEDKFKCEDNLYKIDRITALEDNALYFECEIINTSNETKNLEVYAFALTQNLEGTKATTDEEYILANFEKSCMAIKTSIDEERKITLDTPTGFAYRTVQSVLYNEETAKVIESNGTLGFIQGGSISVDANSSKTFNFIVRFGSNKEEVNKYLNDIDLNKAMDVAINYFDEWHKNSNIDTMCNEEYKEIARTNLTAIKAACLNGFVPADLTGHYYANGTPCYYARDSIMISRALLYSGHYKEFEEIINYLVERKCKPNGEFCQRYNGLGEEDEGANNDVFSQIDSIGYFARVIADYYILTKKMLVPFHKFAKYIDVLLGIQSKNNLLGPEGGVNEGVFGPAFITSTNMFIYGGLQGAIMLAKEHNEVEKANAWTELSNMLYKGINDTFIKEEGYFAYGYVTYHDDLIKKYDTPQYFGTLYGYPLNELMEKNNEYLLNHAKFFEDGMGYSEQEYHHGPWIFNTAACAQYLYLAGNEDEYNKKLKWIKEHSNDYGLMPEAIDATNEENCWINPLTWACAEFVCACFAKQKKELI